MVSVVFVAIWCPLIVQLCGVSSLCNYVVSVECAAIWCLLCSYMVLVGCVAIWCWLVV